MVQMQPAAVESGWSDAHGAIMAGAGRLPPVPAEFVVADPTFDSCGGDAFWDHHYDRGRWTEGPLYVPAGRYLLFSDIPNDRILRWDEATEMVLRWPAAANYANGRTLDRQGRVVTCEQGTRRVSRTEHDGTATVVADRVQGARLNSPNDVVVAVDGAIWFTDPIYGIRSDYEGYRADPETDGSHLYRLAEGGGEPVAVATDFEQPNGLAFSPEGDRLFVVDSGTHPNHIRRFDVGPDGRLTDGRVIAETTAGHFDGIRVDTDGRIWAATGDGVHCIGPDGTLVGAIRLPEPASNLTFGGLKRNRLFVTATRSLYSILLNVNGVSSM